MNSTKQTEGIPVEEYPLTVKSKIEYLNGLALKSSKPEYFISEKEEQQILNNQTIVEKLQHILYDLEQYDELSKTHFYNLKLILKSLLISDTKSQTFGLERRES